MNQDLHLSTDIHLIFCCAGLGMGNASRIVAIIEQLLLLEKPNQKIKITVLTWGASYKFFEQLVKDTNININLIPITPYTSWYKYPITYLINSWKIYHTTKLYPFNLAIIDSDYHFLPYLLRKLKIISISQASDVIFRSEESNYRPNKINEYITFIIREKIDAYLQSLFSNKVLVPCFQPLKHKSPKNSIRIPLIVRKEFLSSIENETETGSIGILLSGSGIEKEKFLSLKKKYNLPIISPDRNKDNFICHANELDKFDIILSQGGLSSISEAIAKEKFLVVFPIKNHPEQIVNAIEVEKLGLGISASIDQLDNFELLKSKIFKYKEEFNASKISCNGAEIAAQLIFSEAFFSKINN